MRIEEVELTTHVMEEIMSVPMGHTRNVQINKQGTFQILEAAFYKHVENGKKYYCTISDGYAKYSECYLESAQPIPSLSIFRTIKITRIDLSNNRKIVSFTSKDFEMV